MKLIDLDPNWFTTTEGRHGMGITFLCPHCKEQALGIWFANPIDCGPPADPVFGPAPRWHREGDTFENMTISPSIDVSAHGHWHGFIINGEIK